MALTSGTRIGPYEVKSPLGEGGMGVVYRARDTKLQRDVALKLLPDHFSDDPDRLARFEREAQVLASLNHQHIAQIYGLEESGTARCIVMELVEGPTLAERLAGYRLRAVGSGPETAMGLQPTDAKSLQPKAHSRTAGVALPLVEALSIARQICQALEAAHEKGVTHRDLKPANIKLTNDGTVKVLDFGLAKVREAEGDASLTNSPTIMAASMPGTVLGTAAYMSPEQARGKEVDRTSDVWAFGCVLYEMLTGRAVFEGESVGEIIGGVFRAEPDWTRLPAETPDAIRRLLRRCLRKDRKQRLQCIDDARIEIDETGSGTQAEAVVANATPSRKERYVLPSTLAFVMLIAVGAIAWALRPVPPALEVRLDVTTPPTTSPVSLAISPDGRRLVFVAMSDGPSRLWLRSLDSASARPLTATEGASLPFWSPDSRSVAFF